MADELSKTGKIGGVRGFATATSRLDKELLALLSVPRTAELIGQLIAKSATGLLPSSALMKLYNAPALVPALSPALRPVGQPSTSINSVADLGQLVREERRSRKLSQQEFADIAGVGRRFLSELENGKASLEIDKVLKVASAAGLEFFARQR